MTFKYLGGLMAGSLLVSAVLATTPALAALGRSADSVGADTAVLRGQLRSTPFVEYDQHQIVTGDLIVNEYVTRAGQVFAVTWHGPVPPNLRQLLGDYFGRVQSAAAGPRPGMHHFFRLVQSDLVVLNTGRLRAFRGIAYLPALVPQGVSISDLR